MTDSVVGFSSKKKRPAGRYTQPAFRPLSEGESRTSRWVHFTLPSPFTPKITRDTASTASATGGWCTCWLPGSSTASRVGHIRPEPGGGRRAMQNEKSGRPECLIVTSAFGPSRAGNQGARDVGRRAVFQWETYAFRRFPPVLRTSWKR